MIVSMDIKGTQPHIYMYFDLLSLLIQALANAFLITKLCFYSNFEMSFHRFEQSCLKILPPCFQSAFPDDILVIHPDSFV